MLWDNPFIAKRSTTSLARPAQPIAYALNHLTTRCTIVSIICMPQSVERVWRFLLNHHNRQVRQLLGLYSTDIGLKILGMRGGGTRYGLLKLGSLPAVSTEKMLNLSQIYESIKQLKLRLYNFLLSYSPTYVQLISAIKIIPCGYLVRAMT